MLTATPENLLLLKGMFLLVLAVHLAFAAALTGGTIVSLVFAFFGSQDRVPAYMRLARNLVEAVTQKKSVVFSLCLTLLVALGAADLIYAPAILTAPLWGILVGTLFIGLTLIYLYRHRLLRCEKITGMTLLSGTAGLILVLGVYLLICFAGALLQMPYTWPHLSDTPQIALSWTGAAHFLEFLLIGLGITGVGMRLFSRLALQKDQGDREHLEAVQKWGTCLALTMLLLPPVILFDLINLPRFALSATVFALALLALGVTALIILHLAEIGDARPRKPGKLLMGGVLGALSLLILMDHAVREQALAAESLPLPEIQVEVEQQPAEPSDTLVQKGEEIFNTRCTACHSFERRVVGPPLNEVLPKYRDDEEALKDFIRSPVEKNPDYPAMPDLGLSDQDIEAVAAFLLNRLES